MRFWIAGTCSAGISTPRSPRATITASASSTIASRLADRRRLLQFRDDADAIPDDLPHLPDILHALHERQRQPIDAKRQAEFEIAAILVGHRGERQDDVRHVDALPLRKRPADHDRRLREVRPAAFDAKLHAAVIEQKVRAGLSAAKISGCGSATRFCRRACWRRDPAETRRLFEMIGPFANVPIRSFGPCRSSSTPIGPAGVLFDRRG